MSTPFHLLRQSYPWPEQFPADLKPNEDGWCGDSNKRMLSKCLLSTPNKTVIELGSFAGLSTRFMLAQDPHVRVICIDTWEGGSDHDKSKLDRLYDQFVVNMKPYRDWCVPLRMTTVAGLWACEDAHLTPGMIYIDAGHRYEDVAADLETAARLFPDAILCGDDFLWGDGGVARAVEEWCARNNRCLAVDDNRAWWVPEGRAQWIACNPEAERFYLLGKVPVTWHQHGGSRFTAYPDGSAVYGLVKGRWAFCGGRSINFTWENRQVDSYEFAADNATISGMNSHFQPIIAKPTRWRQIPR